ncbi:MAG TPA: hypothetical protein VKP67_23450 [Xanthobacteraceae bacterium]|nr:hypothetical protein [Xanthobacteraceae bacterium]
MKCYDEAAQVFGWKRRDQRPGSMRDGEWLIGWGCATAVYPTHVGAATARVRLLPGGSAICRCRDQPATEVGAKYGLSPYCCPVEITIIAGPQRPHNPKTNQQS